MRSLALLTLTVLMALPLSAHDHGRDRHPMVVESCRPFPRWEARRWDHRWERQTYRRGYDCDEGRILLRRDGCEGGRIYLRPSLPPFEGRVVLHFH